MDQIPVALPFAFPVYACAVEESVEEAAASAAVSSLLPEWVHPEYSALHSVESRWHISKVYMKIATEALLDQSQAALHDDALLPALS